MTVVDESSDEARGLGQSAKRVLCCSGRCDVSKHRESDGQVLWEVVVPSFVRVVGVVEHQRLHH